VRQHVGVTADRLPSAPRVEELMEHASWLRGLAGALVRDSSAADDLAQDTWLAAMRSPPPDGVAPRAWLAGIARNLARMRFRGASRRERRERGAAGSAALPGPDELIERFETQRRLAALVAGLAEPVRSIVLLRYYEGLDSKEIALRLGLPPGTVRWRLKQGLDELRARLDEAHGGDRARWTLAFAPLAAPDFGAPPGGPTRAAPQWTGLGGALMASTSKLAATGVAVLLLVAGALWFGSRGDGAEADAPRRGTATATSSTTPDAAGGPSSTERRRPRPRDESAPDSAAPSAPKTTTTPSPREVARVTGRVVDAAGSPVAEATLRIDFGGKDRNVAPDGRFDVEVPTARETQSVAIQIAAPRHAVRVLSKRLARGAVADLGDVVLAAGGVVSGRVVDDAGAPVPSAWIVLASVPVEDADAPRPTPAAGSVSARPPASGGGPRFTFGPDQIPGSMLEPAPRGPVVTSDADGAFTLSNVAVDAPTALRVGAMGHRHASPVVAARADAPVEGVRVVLPRLKENEGIEGVVTAPDGSPAADYEFRVEFGGPAITGSVPARTDAQGRFHLETLDQTTYSVIVDDPGRGWTSARVGGLLPGRRDVVLAAKTSRTVGIDARGADGERVAAFSFQVSIVGGPFGRSAANDGQATAERPARVFVPGGPFSLTVTAPGFAATTAENIDPDRVDDPIVVALTPLPRWRGVVRAASRPVAGARVSLHRALDAGEARFTRGFPLTRDATKSATAVTDAQGAFDVTIREAGRYLVRAEADGFVVGESAVVAIEPATGGDLPVVELGRGGVLDGTVKTGGTRGPEGLLVGAARGDGDVLAAKVGADGRYRFDHVAAGPWIVRVIDEVPPVGTTICMKSDAPIEWSCEVREGETTRRDLGVGAGAACVVRGRLTTAGGREWFVGIAYPDLSRGSTDDKSVEVAADGSFEIATERVGDYWLMFMTAGLEARVYVPVRLAAGERRVDLALEVGAVEVVAPAEKSRASRNAVWTGADGTFGISNPRRDDDRVVFPVVPVGRVRIVRYDPGSKESDLRKWPSDAEVDVTAGTTRRVEIR